VPESASRDHQRSVAAQRTTGTAGFLPRWKNLESWPVCFSARTASARPRHSSSATLLSQRCHDCRRSHVWQDRAGQGRPPEHGFGMALLPVDLASPNAKRLRAARRARLFRNRCAPRWRFCRMAHLASCTTSGSIRNVHVLDIGARCLVGKQRTAAAEILDGLFIALTQSNEKPPRALVDEGAQRPKERFMCSASSVASDRSMSGCRSRAVARVRGRRCQSPPCGASRWHDSGFQRRAAQYAQRCGRFRRRSRLFFGRRGDLVNHAVHVIHA